VRLEETVDVRIAALPAGQALVRDSPLTDKDNNNSCLVTIFEIGPQGQDIELGLQAAVMMQWMFQPFFDDLRTKQ
jgi:secreted Zn-dependent insulinase-like peptidase